MSLHLSIYDHSGVDGYGLTGECDYTSSKRARLTRASLGLSLQGAAPSDAGLVANDGSRSPIRQIKLFWRPELPQKGYACPVYLHADRVTVLFFATLPTQESSDTLTQRGVCLLANP